MKKEIKKSKTWFITKIIILIATILLGCFFGYRFVANKSFDGFMNIMNCLGIILLISLVLWFISGIVSIFMRRRVIVHKFSGYMILMCALFFGCIFVSLKGTTDIKGIDAGEIKAEVYKDPLSEYFYKKTEQTPIQCSGKYNDISSGWVDPNTGDIMYGQLLDLNDTTTKINGRTYAEIVEGKGDIKRGDTLTKYYSPTTKEIYYIVNNIGKGSQVMGEDGVDILVMTRKSKEKGGVGELEVVLRNMRIGDSMAEVIGGGDTIHAKGVTLD